MKPTVGITAATETINYGAWKDVPAFMSPANYVWAVQRAGGRPVLLIPDEEDTKNPSEVLNLVDAVIITGGAGDLDPELYGQEPHPQTGPVQKERDAYELTLVRAAVEREAPTLGICRGMQVLNVAYGGTVEQHLPDVVGHEEHRPLPGVFVGHQVRLLPDSLAARTAGSEVADVRSHHHQGIREVGDGLSVTGRAMKDDTVEAVEDPAHPFVLGVLWHPEEDEKSRIIKALVSEVIK